MQILTQRAAQNKQTLMLVGYKHATIDNLVSMNIRFLKMPVKFCLFIR